jgi:hypothetical protein
LNEFYSSPFHRKQRLVIWGEIVNKRGCQNLNFIAVSRKESAHEKQQFIWILKAAPIIDLYESKSDPRQDRSLLHWDLDSIQQTFGTSFKMKKCLKLSFPDKSKVEFGTVLLCHFYIFSEEALHRSSWLRKLRLLTCKSSVS